MIIDEEVYLEHFGRLGMKWGQRSAARSANRSMNKASRKADWKKQGKQVDAARGRRKSGAIKKEWKASKAQFHKDKVTKGSREARKIMNKKRGKLNAEINKSNQVKTGKGQAAVLLGTVGLIGLSAFGGRGR